MRIQISWAAAVIAALICPLPSVMAKTIRLQTATFAVQFQVGDDGRLYQRPIGADNETERLNRDDEAYPQAE